MLAVVVALAVMFWPAALIRYGDVSSEPPGATAELRAMQSESVLDSEPPRSALDAETETPAHVAPFGGGQVPTARFRRWRTDDPAAALAWMTDRAHAQGWQDDVSSCPPTDGRAVLTKQAGGRLLHLWLATNDRITGEPKPYLEAGMSRAEAYSPPDAPAGTLLTCPRQ